MTHLVTSSTSTLVASAEPLARPWVARLFERLRSQLGSKLADLYAGSRPEDVQAEWALGLAGYTPQELSRGLSACSDRQFAPNLGEFKRLCRPALDPEYAWYEAQDGLRARDRGERGVWSHPAVWRAARELAYEIRHANGYAQMRKRWEMVLNREFASGWGEEVPDPAPRIEHREPSGVAIPAEVSRRKLADLLSNWNRKDQ